MVAAALFDGRDTAKGAVRCNVCVSGRGQGGGGANGRIAWVTSGRNACSGTCTLDGQGQAQRQRMK